MHAMKEPSTNLILSVFLIDFLLCGNAAHADIYIDTSASDEISISNIPSSDDYTIKITEPSLHPLKTLGQSSKNTVKIHLPYQQEVALAASENAVEPALIQAVMTVESAHNPHAKSKKGAYGLMQLMPETSSRFNVSNVKDPKQNILGGTRYLRELLNLYKGDLNLVLAAYNAGPAAVKKYGGQIPPYKETINYVPKVLKYYRLYS
jgi:soluble lytic murein transglycosylase-like protein